MLAQISRDFLGGRLFALAGDRHSAAVSEGFMEPACTNVVTAASLPSLSVIWPVIGNDECSMLKLKH
jgi:hypothetical protein